MCVSPPEIRRVKNSDDWAVYTTIYLRDDLMVPEVRPLATFHGIYAEVNARAYAKHMVSDMCGGPCMYGFNPAQVDYGQTNPYEEEN